MNKVLLTYDLNCSRITPEQYLLIRKIVREQASGEVDIQVYNYLAKKHTFVYTDEHTTLHPYIGSHKRITLDLNQALDCVDCVVANNIKDVYILCGEYDSEYLWKKLDNLGVRYHKITLSASQVSIGNTTYNIEDSDLLDGDLVPYNRLESSQTKSSIEECTIPQDMTDVASELVEEDKVVNLVNIPNDISNSNNISKDQLKVLIKYVLDKKYCVTR